MKSKVNTYQFKTISWADIEDRVKQLNPHLHRLISALSPDESYRIYRAKYPYGTIFVKNGQFAVPNKQGEMTAISSDSIPRQMKEDLSYNKGTNPVSLVLSKQIELYLEEGMFDVPITFGLIPPGHLLSTSYILSPEQTFHPRFKWNISCGARSIFSLPKITNKRCFQRLKKSLHLQSESPKKYTEHWPLFREISSVVDPDWNVDILFFSKKWFDRLEDEAWRDLYNYLLQSFQQSYQFWTNKFMWDMACSFIIKKRSLKPSLYIANTIKHLLFIATGATCGMGPAIDNECAPISSLQNALLNVYNIKDYIPTIFIPKRFNMYDNNAKPVYYSFNYPNMMEMTIRPRQHESLLTDLYETFAMLNKYIEELQSTDLNLIGSPLYDIQDNAKFSAFHADAEPYQLLRHSDCLAKEDNDLLKLLVDNGGGQAFNHHSSFFKACIRVNKE